MNDLLYLAAVAGGSFFVGVSVGALLMVWFNREKPASLYEVKEYEVGTDEYQQIYDDLPSFLKPQAE